MRTGVQSWLGAGSCDMRRAPISVAKIVLVAVTVYLFGTSTAVFAQIIATPNIEELCKSAPAATYRKTLVYVDLSAIVKGKTDWGLTILNKLEFAPRESFTLLGVN